MSTPVIGRNATQGRNVLAHREYIVGEVEWLTGTDSPENIATRLGYRNLASIARLLERAGRNDLATQFWSAISTARARAKRRAESS